MSGGKLDTGRPLNGSDGVATAVGEASPIDIDGSESAARAIEGVLESVAALLPDSRESAVQDNMFSIASRLTVSAATTCLTRHIASLTRNAEKIRIPNSLAGTFFFGPDYVKFFND
jgi:hypothetical protein